VSGPGPVASGRRSRRRAWTERCKAIDRLIPIAQTPSNRTDLPEIAAVVCSFARARVALRGARRGARVRCYGRILVPQPEGIDIGERTIFLGGSILSELRCAPGAELVIGAQSIFNYGAFVSARRSVRIGARCRVASLVHIRDDDGRTTEPVTIGDDVWLAHGAIVEPGSVIGDGAVIATMTVVSGKVPPRSLAMGNPARYFPLETEAGELPAAFASPDPLIAAPAARSPHSPEDVRAAIIEWLDDTRHFGAAASLITSDAMSLRAGGLLDSLGLVQLVLMLEKRFRVTIARDRAAHAESQSLKGLIDLVTRPVASRT
jgi:acetyltransferase-like isoleucine patch superfamily enzyme/acyl carrier protein